MSSALNFKPVTYYCFILFVFSLASLNINNAANSLAKSSNVYQKLQNVFEEQTETDNRYIVYNPNNDPEIAQRAFNDYMERRVLSEEQLRVSKEYDQLYINKYTRFKNFLYLLILTNGFIFIIFFNLKLNFVFISSLVTFVVVFFT